MKLEELILKFDIARAATLNQLAARPEFLRQIEAMNETAFSYAVSVKVVERLKAARKRVSEKERA